MEGNRVSGKSVFIFLLGILLSNAYVHARPATFSEDFRITWADDHIQQMAGGNAIQLKLDQNSGLHNTAHIVSLGV